MVDNPSSARKIVPWLNIEWHPPPRIYIKHVKVKPPKEQEARR